MSGSIVNTETPDGYFSNVRSDIAPLLPAHLGRVLEVGCATGATLRWLKEKHGATETIGIELNPALETELRANVDVAVISGAEAAERDFGKVDTLLLLDVLEHMVEPQAMLATYARHLAPGGVVIASIPNIAHFQVLRSLLTRQFRYTPAGILDHTHLRFFTEESIDALMASAGLSVTHKHLLMGPRWSKFARLVGAQPMRRFDHYLAIQYLVSATAGETAAPATVTRQWVDYAASGS